MPTLATLMRRIECESYAPIPFQKEPNPVTHVDLDWIHDNYVQRLVCSVCTRNFFRISLRRKCVLYFVNGVVFLKKKKNPEKMQLVTYANPACQIC